MGVRERFNVTELGDPAAPPILFAHGFGCDQSMWRHVAPRFAADHHVVLYDLIGMGGTDPGDYDAERYSTLHGYALDVLEIAGELALRDVVFVGHSVSAMSGVLAAAQRPELFSSLVLVGPSPRYIDDEGYVGGFSAADIDDLLATLERNFLGWSAAMAPVIMGNPGTPDLGAELTRLFCAADPDIARRFAEVTFRSDQRADLKRVATRTLVLQCSNDVIAPTSVGAYVAEQMPAATLVQLRASGHCPNLSAPDEVTDAIADFLAIAS
ncbi:MAG TPA: alpha/beta hydrolase [Mycobacteriales bacterium]|nr:alpha/beta hydrolase [Mycobacteriales bacterium]